MFSQKEERGEHDGPVGGAGSKEVDELHAPRPVLRRHVLAGWCDGDVWQFFIQPFVALAFSNRRSFLLPS